jgi:hypothetical protein
LRPVQHEVGYRSTVLQRQPRQRRADAGGRGSAVAGDRHDARPGGPQRRLADLGAPDLELREAAVLEALDQHQVATLHVAEQGFQRRLVGAAQFVHQRPAIMPQQQHLHAARFAQAVRVLARAVDVDGLVAVLDQRDDHAARADSSGTSRSSSVVLPMPEWPAIPNTFMRLQARCRGAFCRLPS